MHKLKDIISAGSQRFSARIFSVAMLWLAVGFCAFNVAVRTNAVLIRDNNETSVLSYTFSSDYNDILEDNGIYTLAADKVSFSGLEGGYAEINISRAFPISLTADGKTYATMVTDGAVSDAFEQLGIEYDSDDLVSPALEKPLSHGDAIELNRVEYITRTVQETIPYDVVTRSNSLIGHGRNKLLVSGEEGVKNMTYLERTVDGEVEDAELIGENILSTPVDKQVLVGEKTAPVSPLDFGVPMDDMGRPLYYTAKMSDQSATGYNAGKGARGASGKGLSPGYVAVNPNKIPYGTKMYITSSDGSFVYGYAIAADTGTGLMNDIINVDLYYETYVESCLNGRRNVDIYILN